MDLPPEYVLHLLPLMMICGIAPTQSQSPPISEQDFILDQAKLLSPPSLASIPYIDLQLGHVILKVIDKWRQLALWEPSASKEWQIPGASLEGLFRILPVDRVSVRRS